MHRAWRVRAGPFLDSSVLGYQLTGCPISMRVVTLRVAEKNMRKCTQTLALMDRVRGLGVSSDPETPQRCGGSKVALRCIITEVFGVFLIPARVPAASSVRGHQEWYLPVGTLFLLPSSLRTRLVHQR